MAKARKKRKSARARRCSIKGSIGLVQVGSTVWECCARKLGSHKIAACHKMDPKHPAMIRLAARRAAVAAAAAAKAAQYETRGTHSYGPGYGLLEESSRSKYRAPALGGMRRRRRRKSRR